VQICWDGGGRRARALILTFSNWQEMRVRGYFNPSKSLNIRSDFFMSVLECRIRDIPYFLTRQIGMLAR
jgi:hypothetical protein